jgi:hypothetical protein
MLSALGGRCRLTVTNPALKAPMVSALAIIIYQRLSTLAFNFNLRRYSAVDSGLDENNRVVPGVGEFGDRYFGTEEMKGKFLMGENDDEDPTFD